MPVLQIIVHKTLLVQLLLVVAAVQLLPVVWLPLLLHGELLPRVPLCHVLPAVKVITYAYSNERSPKIYGNFDRFCTIQN